MILHLTPSVRLADLAWAKAESTAPGLGGEDMALSRVRQRVKVQLELARCEWPQVPADPHPSDSRQDCKVDSASSLLGSLHTISSDYYEARYELMIRRSRSLVVRAANFGNSQYVAWGHIGHALGLWRGGNRSAALTALRESIAHVDRSGDFLCQSVAYAVSALLNLEQGDPAEALSWADKALSLSDHGMPTGQGFLEGYASLVEVYLSLWRSASTKAARSELGNKLQRASAALGKYAQIYRLGRPRASLYEGLRAQSGEPAEPALALFELCIKRAARAKMPYEEGRGHLALAAALPIAAPHRQTHLQRALSLFSGIGAKYEEEQARQLLAGGEGP